ncbi:MAG: galactose-1-phosphate uridylyltransferase [Oligoflexia bacterium]|nr:galactose-1-phosphate uridylyltransferase [Oligoflexia bacterium]
MDILNLTKQDGRYLTLYSNTKVDGIDKNFIPSPNKEMINPTPHLRYHPLRGEWVAYANHRQNRTFLPPAEYNPLAPTKNKEIPTELPDGTYDVAVFANLFPSLVPSQVLQKSTAIPLQIPGMDAGVDIVEADGVCEVVVFSTDAKTNLSLLPLDHIKLIFKVWGHRYLEILKINPNIKYIMPFENRGVEMGVTLHHPHGQIYAYPFIPPIPARELELQLKYYNEHAGIGLLEQMVKDELSFKKRVVVETDSALSFVPRCARYPYEVWSMPKRPVENFNQLTDNELTDLATTLKSTLLKFDALWDRESPYLMVIHQASTDGLPHPEAHLHFEIYPALRTKEKLKYLAGTELGAGMFANDCIPEEKAQELREVKIQL